MGFGHRLTVLGLSFALLISVAARAETAGQSCQKFGQTVIAQDKVSALACLYSKPYPEGSIQPAPPLVWKLETIGRPAGITGGCAISTGKTKFPNGEIANALTVSTKWGWGCADGPNAGVNDQFDDCNYAADAGYVCGTISVPPKAPGASRSHALCACVQQ